jgi:hypothetical protein
MARVSMSANGQYSLSCLIASGLLYRSITPFANTMASVNLLSQTLQPAALTYSDGSALTSASEPLDYSTFGINWTQSGSTSQSWNAPAISASGQYQIACIFNGLPHYSSNYGQTWTASNAPNANWRSVCISASGQYASAGGASSANGTITSYYSSNYGQTWIASSFTGFNFAMACSASGQYQVHGQGQNAFGYGIYYSSDYGKTFTVSNNTTSNQCQYSAMSASGQYVLVVQNAVTNISMFISNNYGRTFNSVTLGFFGYGERVNIHRTSYNCCRNNCPVQGFWGFVFHRFIQKSTHTHSC